MQADVATSKIWPPYPFEAIKKLFRVRLRLSLLYPIVIIRLSSAKPELGNKRRAQIFLLMPAYVAIPKL